MLRRISKFRNLKKKNIILAVLLLMGISMQAQVLTDSVRIYADSIVKVNVDELQEVEIVAEPITGFVLDSISETVVLVDSIQTEIVDTILVETDSVFKPDPLKAVWLGAIIPGYGQIVNRKYWKLPIVYGGFLGFAYAISWNNSRYTSYKNAYRDIIDNDPTTNYHIEILPRGYTLENYPGGVSTYTARLKSAQEQFRQYRDLSIILSVGYYALVLLEAFVDAHLYDFDINPDLVLNVTPTRIDFDKKQNIGYAYGLQCSIRF
ncbi:MAG: hypothetical protein GX102_15880 [Porphyromonadaceae bacterium]|nr:hypothetical protein [Porphyromonadaceae bacterium]